MKVSKMKALYEKAKAEKTGNKIQCPSCGNWIVKNQYNTTFCSRKCKDKYWNTVDPNKRCRKNDYYYNVIRQKEINKVYDSLPDHIYQNIDTTTFEEFVIKNKLQSMSKEKVYSLYRTKVLKENSARIKGFSSVREMEDVTTSECLGEYGESFGCTLSICECCGKRVDVCECEQYWDNY